MDGTLMTIALRSRVAAPAGTSLFSPALPIIVTLLERLEAP